MTLQPKCEDVETAEGVAITVTGVAQVNHHTFLGMPVQTRITPDPSSIFWHLVMIPQSQPFFYYVLKAHYCLHDIFSYLGRMHQPEVFLSTSFYMRTLFVQNDASLCDAPVFFNPDMDYVQP